MALQTIKSGFWFPDTLSYMSETISQTDFLIDASGEKVGFIFTSPKTGNIDRVTFRVGTLTTAQTLRVGLYTVDTATGDPTTTAYGGMTVGTQTSPAANTMYEVTLGTAAATTVGDYIAMVIEFDSTVGNLAISGLNIVGGSTVAGVPYLDHLQGAGPTWGKSSFRLPLMTIRYDDATYEVAGGIPVGTVTATSYNSGSATNEIGHYFSLPGPVRAAGIAVSGDFDEGTDIVLYDSDGTTVLRTVSLDKDIRAQTSRALYRIRFSPLTLSKNTNYRLVVKPTTVTNIQLYEFSVLSAGMMDGVPGGQNCYKTAKTSGTWGQTTTSRVWGLSLLIDQIDDAVSAGGLAANPTGGFVR